MDSRELSGWANMWIALLGVKVTGKMFPHASVMLAGDAIILFPALQGL